MKFIETAYAAPEEAGEVHATEAQADAGVLASLGINGTLLTAQFINFALVVLVLWFLILKPLTKKMTERQEIIDKSLDNAKKVEENLLESEKKYQEKMDEAKQAANAVIENAAAEAEKTGDALKAKAKQEIEVLVEQAKRNIRLEKEEMKAEIKKEAGQMIILALEKILSEKMTDKKDKDLIAEMVKKLQ